MKNNELTEVAICLYQNVWLNRLTNANVETESWIRRRKKCTFKHCVILH